jgi:hypothetical protein
MRGLRIAVLILGSLGALYLGWSVTAVAGHHAGSAEFDHSRQVSVMGKVVRVDWGNPHVLFQVEVKDAAGAVRVWTMDTAPYHLLQNLGWCKDTLKAGDQVSVKSYPSKNGNPRGYPTEVVFEGRNLLSGPSFSIAGKVTRIHWAGASANVSLELEARDEKGAVTPWVIETNTSAMYLEARGWRPDAVKVGDEINVQGALTCGVKGKVSASEIRFLGRILFSNNVVIPR